MQRWREDTFYLTAFSENGDLVLDTSTPAWKSHPSYALGDWWIKILHIYIEDPNKDFIGPFHVKSAQSQDQAFESFLLASFVKSKKEKKTYVLCGKENSQSWWHKLTHKGDKLHLRIGPADLRQRGVFPHTCQVGVAVRIN